MKMCEIWRCFYLFIWDEELLYWTAFTYTFVKRQNKFTQREEDGTFKENVSKSY